MLGTINSLVQAAKRRARCQRTKKNLIARTYLIAGKLDLAVIHRKRCWKSNSKEVLDAKVNSG